MLLRVVRTERQYVKMFSRSRFTWNIEMYQYIYFSWYFSSHLNLSIFLSFHFIIFETHQNSSFQRPWVMTFVALMVKLHLYDAFLCIYIYPSVWLGQQRRWTASVSSGTLCYSGAAGTTARGRWRAANIDHASGNDTDRSINIVRPWWHHRAVVTSPWCGAGGLHASWCSRPAEVKQVKTQKLCDLTSISIDR